ncbi:phytoene dehydrogenase AL-1 (carotenoid biosynthesis al-1) [Fusarium sp. NRRL 52700]|nr:phytoene dehydrogenase AL-1 (carotenoid biosynthesis al-1) [Fusarium sp. NRRL 52700]
MSDIKKSVIVIGAGVGGVSTAARLAKAGFKVTILEKNDFTGGRCSLIHNDGHRFDQGPSLLLLPRFFHEIFQDLGTSLTAEGVELLKCEPNYNIWFGDGSSFEMSTDLTKMKKAIEAVEGIDGFERYLGFLQESHRHYEHSESGETRGAVQSVQYSSPGEYMDKSEQILLDREIEKGLHIWNLLQYTELAEGILYPRGGFHKVVEALVNVGQRLGVEYRLSTGVKSISIDQATGKANGVVLSDGTHLPSDIVISNADLVYTYNNLLPKTSYADSLSKRETSCSSISFYWSASKIVPELNAHNIFLADEYQESFDSIFKEHLIPSEPSFYVNVPSRIDPSAAPEGKDSIVVLVPVGHLLSDSEGTHRGLSKSGNSGGLETSQDWDKMISLARDTVIATMRARIGVDLAPLIENEIINTPFTWQEKFNLDKGAILGLSHSIMNVLAFRPGTQHSKYKNLYFAGASTHPGTGVPVCIAGSKIVAEQILKDSGFKSHQIPWAQDTAKSPKGGLDKMSDSSLTLFQGFLGALVAMLLAYYYLVIAAN